MAALVLATFRRTGSATVDVGEATVIWRSAGAGNYGEAELFLRRESPAFAPEYLADDGGGLVEVSDPVGGVWVGVVDAAKFSSDGVRLHAVHLSGLLGALNVGYDGRFLSCTPGMLARAAMDRCLGGSGGLLRRGVVAECGPVIREFRFSGQRLGEALGELTAASGQEWVVNDDGTVDWQPPDRRVLDAVLVDGVELGPTNREGFADAPVSEVYGRGAGGQYAFAGLNLGRDFWRRQETVNSGDAFPLEMAHDARRRLVAQQQVATVWRTEIARSAVGDGAVVAFGGQVSDGWGDMAWGDAPWGGTYLISTSTATTLGLRERDILTVLLPRHGLAGRRVVARVIGRTLVEGSSRMLLDLVELPPLVAGEIALPGEYLDQSAGRLRPEPTAVDRIVGVENRLRALEAV